MNQKVGINVSATADTSQVEQAINALGQKIAQANRVQYSPVSTKSLDDVKKLNAALAEMLKTQAGLRQRVKATGQDATPFADWDWQRMYPHAASRGVAMQGAFERVVGPGRFTAPPPAQPQQPNQPQPGGGGAGMGTRIVQAGLSAAGPVGGVASGALGTGMSAGFGAGLMGLVGGIAALGVGKLVSAIAEKVGQAEQLEVDYDTLKRKLGDVGVGFDALKGVVQGSAKQLSITFDEAGKLSAQFAKLSNLSGDQYKTLNEELESGVGLSRSFGLDPSQGVGILGQMRGMGITTNTQESRRFALLLGETIGKSGAFAKAEEVFEAIGGYATSQTRQSMGAANVAGFAGMYSSMVGSGIPGMDPTGAAGLLNKINSVLAGGGAKGEASQFFTGIVGHRMGLNPFQTQVLREGGGFATNSEAFGKDSAYAKYMGEVGPKGGTTLLQESLDEMRGQYEKDGTKEDKQNLAMATANHLGINARQAMALLVLEPNQMREMEKHAGDLTKMSESGILNLSKSLYGTADERQALKSNFLGRTGADAISQKDRDALDAAKTDDELKKALASMAAKYDQERTSGQDVRDSKNLLDNIKVEIASKLIPLNQSMRDGILYMAGIMGGGKKSRLEVMKDIESLESGDREKKIKGDISNRTEAVIKNGSVLQNRLSALGSIDRIRVEHRGDPAKMAEKLKEREQLVAAIAENEKKLVELGREQRGLLAKENELKAKNIKAIEDAHTAEMGAVPPRDQSDAETARLKRRGQAPATASPAAAAGGGDYDPLSNTPPAKRGSGIAPHGETASALSEFKDPEERKNVKAFLDTLSATEGAGYNTVVGGGKFDGFDKHPNKVGLVTGDGPSTAAGRYQITGTTWRGVSKKLGLNDFSPESQDKAAIELIRQRGALDDVRRGDWASAVPKLGGEWQSLPSGTSKHQGKRTWSEFNSAMEKAKKGPAPNVATEPNYKPGAVERKELPPPGRAPVVAAEPEKKPAEPVAKPPGRAPVVAAEPEKKPAEPAAKPPGRAPVVEMPPPARQQKDGTPAGDLGAGASGGPSAARGGMQPASVDGHITVHVVDEKTSKPIGPPQKIPVKAGAASPFGTLSGVTGQW
jgi:muramidase (phage lysozyme)